MKRIVAVILCVILIGSVIAACEKNPETYAITAAKLTILDKYPGATFDQRTFTVRHNETDDRYIVTGKYELNGVNKDFLVEFKFTDKDYKAFRVISSVY